jgi:hypothetical protein
MSSRRTALAVGLVALTLLAAAPACAVIGTIDAVPAATLLLPYFEVDLTDPSGANTLFSVNNASATAILAHVVIYSDLSVPVLDFNIYLTGYDVQTINLRDILVNGHVPQTASAGQDPNDTISKQGPKSQDINFASCTGQLPPPPLPASFLQHLALSLTGKASPLFGGLCSGRDLGDNIARGYITVDTVNNCTLRLPSDPAYFANDITFQNVLWGDVIYATPSLGLADGETLVHVEASLTDPITTTSGRYTFYGRYVGWNASDHREPLVTHFAARYAVGGDDFSTDYIVWRDSKTNQTPFVCPFTFGRPSWYPLGEEGIVIFDEEETPQTPTSFPFSPQPPQDTIIPFPAEAQRVSVGGPDLPVPFSFGWVLLDLNTTITGNPNPPVDPAAAQAWVVDPFRKLAKGRFSVGFSANQLDSAGDASHALP